MATQRQDRTGAQYGAVTVLGTDPDNQRLWRVRWGCCGREQSVTPERCRGMDRTSPMRCITCVRREDSEDEAYSESRQAREKERMRQKRIAAKLLENHPEERNACEGVTVPGWGFVPVLTGPFGRLNATGYEAQYKADRPWADEGIAA
jgi:hypothetical protein